MLLLKEQLQKAQGYADWVKNREKIIKEDSEDDNSDY